MKKKLLLALLSFFALLGVLIRCMVPYAPPDCNARASLLERARNARAGSIRRVRAIRQWLFIASPSRSGESL